MDFGDILAKWEKKNSGTGYNDKDFYDYRNRNSAGERRSRLLRKRPDAFIDLHGLGRDEAWTALESFFDDSKKKGHEKLLVIHGKGNHSGFVENEKLLRELTRQFIEACSYAGESGFGSGREGGSGATWVILRQPAAN